MYDLVKKLLFCLPPEISHEVSLDCMGAAYRLGLLGLLGKTPKCTTTVMGIDFPNPVGLAAGLDKNGDYLNALGALGFGFVEIGTVTPQPQIGNQQPRLFRLVEQNAIINRMGFNNKGVDHLVDQVKSRKYSGVLGINIGKNKATPDENALTDYLICLRKVYNYADYITVNISSPNTPGLRNLQFGDNLKQLINGIMRERNVLELQYKRRVPVAVKIAPDMSDQEVIEVADTLAEAGVDAIIATNTTISRLGVEDSPFANEAGGLSGEPVKAKSTHVIQVLANHLQGALPIIGVGGIRSALDTKEKIDAGASLVQVYSGFIYKGPALIKEAVSAFRKSP